MTKKTRTIAFGRADGTETEHVLTFRTPHVYSPAMVLLMPIVGDEVELSLSADGHTYTLTRDRSHELVRPGEYVPPELVPPQITSKWNVSRFPRPFWAQNFELRICGLTAPVSAGAFGTENDQGAIGES